MKPLTAEHAARFIGTWFKNEKGEPIRVYPWWREVLRAAFDPAIRLLLVNTIRQQGKTQLAMCYLRYLLYVARDMYLIAITCAEGQMQRFVEQKIARPLIHEDPRFSRTAEGREVTEIRGTEIRVPSRNNVLKILPANRATSTGTSPDVIFFDEARDMPAELFDEVAPSIMGRGTGKLFVASTAGAPRGFFYELVNAQESDPRPTWYLYRSCAVLNPATDRETLRAVMGAAGSRAGELRNLENVFAAEGDELLSRDAINEAVNRKLHNVGDLPEALAEHRTNYSTGGYAFVDTSDSRDMTVLVLVERPLPEVEALHATRVIAWKPQNFGSGRIEHAVVCAEIERVLRDYQPAQVEVDNTSGHGGEILSWARRSGHTRVVEFKSTTAKNMEMWGTLRTLLNERKLKIPRNDRLISELAGLKTESFSHGSGWRVVDPDKVLHREISFALARAAQQASANWQRGIVRAENLETLWGQLNAAIA